MSDSLVGKRVLTRYRVIRKLAQGGMGVVYLGRSEGDAGFIRPVVIKTIRPNADNSDAAEMFIREARILSQLSHPGIVNVLDFGQECSEYVMVLEYIRGYDLGHWRRFMAKSDGDVPIDFALHVVTQVLDALSYAHNLCQVDGSSSVVVHRDVSPSNILLSNEGDVRLIDFGIAKMRESTDMFQTRKHVVKGKISYMAPELLGGQPATPSSDVYSVAVLLHELLVGRNELRAMSAVASIRRVLERKPSPIAAYRDDAPDELESILARALGKDPSTRYGSAEALARDIRALPGFDEGRVGREVRQQIRELSQGQLAELLGVEHLAEREGWWRDAARSERPVAQAPPCVSESETVRPPRPDDVGAVVGSKPSVQLTATPEILDAVPPRPADEPPQEARVSARALRIGPVLSLVGPLLLVAGSFGVAQAMLDEPSSAPLIVVESPRRVPTAETAERGALDLRAASPPETTETTGMVETTETVETTEATTPPSTTESRTLRRKKGRASPTARLSRVLRRRAPAFRRCFAEQGRSAMDENMHLTMSVSPSGEVERASVAPRQLGAGSLGRCITGVARAIRFPPLEAPLTFRIPITASIRE